MYRAELIANRSVLDETIECLERDVPGILYTLIPEVCGRGAENRKLGTVTWPELNFVLIAYVEDSDVGLVRESIRALKGRFPREGIKLFLLRSSE
jgi:hypothetical protein